MNKKIKNATKSIFDDIKFDSKLELFFYKLLKDNNIIFEMKNKFILQNKFEYNGINIREISMFPDYYLKDYNTIIEIKGFTNDVFPLKYKMMLNHLNNLKEEDKYYKAKYIILKNQKEMLNYINSLK